MNKGLEALKELDEKHGCFATSNEYVLVAVISQELKEYEALKEELEFRREHEAEDEFWLQKLCEENRLLKEGLRTMHFKIHDRYGQHDIEHLNYYISAEEDPEEYPKIKKMLEVIKNE